MGSRIQSLDVFRGLTIFIMIVVNSPGALVAYSWLEHSDWNGCTLADLVFPFFIVIVGASSVLAMTNLQAKGHTHSQLCKKIIKRTFYIFMLGLLLNVYPHCLPLNAFPYVDLSCLRIAGVLQRIAVCYFFSAMLFLVVSKRAHMMIIFSLLIGYWALLSLFSTDLVGRVDLLVFSSKHLYQPTFDPEGVLSTLPAIASALLGNLL